MARPRTPSFGTFRNLGGDVIVSVDFVPDPEEIAVKLLEVAGYLDNLTRPLLAARERGIADMRDHFDTETAPDGSRWTELDPEYLVSKQNDGYPDDILHREGDLEKAATSQENWVVTEDGELLFRTDNLPVDNNGRPIWFFHQVGTGEDSNWGKAEEYRSNVRFQKEQKLLEGVGGTHESFGIGRGSALPARSFIGLSEQAEEEIGEVFDLWFDEGVALFIHPTTGAAQLRTSGRFGAGIFT